MRLCQKAIEAIGGKDNRPIRLKLALALGFSERWIERLVDHNKPNGDLTTVSALQVISEETGLTQEQILEEEPAKVESETPRIV